MVQVTMKEGDELPRFKRQVMRGLPPSIRGVKAGVFRLDQTSNKLVPIRNADDVASVRAMDVIVIKQDDDVSAETGSDASAQRRASSPVLAGPSFCSLPTVSTADDRRNSFSSATTRDRRASLSSPRSGAVQSNAATASQAPAPELYSPMRGPGLQPPGFAAGTADAGGDHYPRWRQHTHTSIRAVTQVPPDSPALPVRDNRRAKVARRRATEAIYKKYGPRQYAPGNGPRRQRQRKEARQRRAEARRIEANRLYARNAYEEHFNREMKRRQEARKQHTSKPGAGAPVPHPHHAVLHNTTTADVVDRAYTGDQTTAMQWAHDSVGTMSKAEAEVWMRKYVDDHHIRDLFKRTVHVPSVATPKPRGRNAKAASRPPRGAGRGRAGLSHAKTAPGTISRAQARKHIGGNRGSTLAATTRLPRRRKQRPKHRAPPSLRPLAMSMDEARESLFRSQRWSGLPPHPVDTQLAEDPDFQSCVVVNHASCTLLGYTAHRATWLPHRYFLESPYILGARCNPDRKLVRSVNKLQAEQRRQWDRMEREREERKRAALARRFEAAARPPQSVVSEAPSAGSFPYPLAPWVVARAEQAMRALDDEDAAVSSGANEGEAGPGPHEEETEQQPQASTVPDDADNSGKDDEPGKDGAEVDEAAGGSNDGKDEDEHDDELSSNDLVLALTEEQWQEAANVRKPPKAFVMVMGAVCINPCCIVRAPCRLHVTPLSCTCTCGSCACCLGRAPSGARRSCCWRTQRCHTTLWHSLLLLSLYATPVPSLRIVTTVLTSLCAQAFSRKLVHRLVCSGRDRMKRLIAEARGRPRVRHGCRGCTLWPAVSLVCVCGRLLCRCMRCWRCGSWCSRTT